MWFPQAGWSSVGLALRFAPELGLHRYRGNSNSKPTAMGGLWKRCFWYEFRSSVQVKYLFILKVLIMLDRFVSSFTGRLCFINNEECVQLPVRDDSVV
jgi:hypothetical protein